MTVELFPTSAGALPSKLMYREEASSMLIVALIFEHTRTRNLSNDNFQLIVKLIMILNSEVACAPLSTSNESKKLIVALSDKDSKIFCEGKWLSMTKNTHVGFSDINGLIRQIGLVGLVSISGLVGQISLISLVGISGRIGHNGLFGFGLISLIGLSGFGLVGLSSINGLIVQIGLVSLVGLSGFGLISLVGISGFGLVGLVGFISFGLISLVGLSGFGLVGLSGIYGISLIGLGGHNDNISLIGLGFVLSAHWLINFIGLGIEGLISKNGFISLGLVGFIGLGLGSIVNSLQFEIEMKPSPHDLF
jgi:hypothetical protein